MTSLLVLLSRTGYVVSLYLDSSGPVPRLDESIVQRCRPGAKPAMCHCHAYQGWNKTHYYAEGFLGSRVVSVLVSGAEGPGFKSQSRCCRVTVLGKLLTPIMPLFTKQQNW